MINYLNNILTFILCLDFLQRRFPKIEKIGSNIYILIYSYFEVQMKKNGIDIFYEPQIEKVSIVNEDENEDENDFKYYNKEIWDIINKHRTMEKEKYC
jgi:hypothetical protein